MPAVTISRVILFAAMIALTLFMFYRALVYQGYYRAQTFRESAKTVAYLIANQIQQLYVLAQSPEIENETTIQKILDKPNSIGLKPYNLSFILKEYVKGGETHKIIEVKVVSGRNATALVPVGDDVELQPSSVTLPGYRPVTANCYKELFVNGSTNYVFSFTGGG